MNRKTIAALAAPLFAVVGAVSGAALAQQQPVTFRWATGYGQGTLQAMIRSPDESYVAFNCQNSQTAQGPSISVQAHGHSLDGPKTLQLVVDGRSYSMPLLNGVVQRGPSILESARAISMSTAPSFVAAVPEINWRQEFSLGNARNVLLEPSGGTIVERCAP